MISKFETDVSVDEQIKQLEFAIANLEAQRTLLGGAVVDTALGSLRQQLTQLRRQPESLAGERKLLTVLFADISGFTTLSEKLDPEYVRSLMNACFDQLVLSIVKYAGQVDKFIGDAVMALFGAPIAYENHAERALRTALDMMGKMDSFNAEHGTDLGLHVGINTGLVVAGGIGSQGQQQYSVIGDTVNLAARLEDLSEMGQILVGPNTYRLTAPLFEFKPLAPTHIKGKGAPILIYQLFGHKSAPGSLRGIEGLHSPLVGRETEVKILGCAFAALSEGQGSRIGIIGEAGQGKSRLLAEFRQSIKSSITWVEGRALSYTEGMSYWIARDLLYSLLGVHRDSPPEAVNIALYSSVKRFFPETSLEIYPYLAHLLDLPLDAAVEERVKYLNPETLRTRIHQGYIDYIRVRAGENPLVIVWEDLHWADPSSLELLEALLPVTEDVPLLILFATRPEDTQVQKFLERAQSQFTMVELLPLTRQYSHQLLNNLLNIENFPAAIRDLILDKAEGNAFFLEEILRSLIDMELVIIQEHQAVAASAIYNLKELDVPDTLQGVIAARIDRLPNDDKHALQTASVIGRVFQKRILAYLFEREHEEDKVETSLEHLRVREFIRLRAELEYIFKHAVTQDVAYNSLLLARRKALHQLTAEAIELLFPHSLEELSSTLAYHYQRAEIQDKAVFYLMKAADRAKRTYANTEAIALYETAIEILTPEPSMLAGERETLETLYENLGGIWHLIGQQDAALTAFHNALTLVPQSDVIGQSRVYRRIAQTQSLQRCWDAALQTIETAERALGDVPPPAKAESWWEEWLQARLDRSTLYYWLGRPLEIVKLSEHILPHLEQYGTPVMRGNYFNNRALSSLRNNRYVASEEAIHDALTAFKAIQASQDLSQIAWVQFCLGFCLLWARDFAQSEEHLKGALDLTERIGDVAVQSRCLAYLTVNARMQNDTQSVEQRAMPALAAARAGNMTEYIGIALANLAWLALRKGDTNQAKTHVETAYQLLCSVPQIEMFGWIVRWPLLRVNMLQNQIDQAIEQAQHLIAVVTQPQPADIAEKLETAVSAWKASDTSLARSYLEEAAGLAEKKGYL